MKNFKNLVVAKWPLKLEFSAGLIHFGKKYIFRLKYGECIMAILTIYNPLLFVIYLIHCLMLIHFLHLWNEAKCLICLISVIYLSKLIRSCKIDNEFFMERKLDYPLKETFILSLIAEIVIASQLKLASRCIFTKINVIGGTYE